MIERQSRHLQRLIDDLLDVGRVMTGKILLERVPVELAACARHVVGTLQSTGVLAARRIEVDAAPVWVEGDQTRLEQILTNLLVNAARYTRADGRIRVSVAREADDAVLVVSDDGQGIAPENLGRVFELFFQAEATADRATGGLGIGLTLVQRLARFHGGDVTAASGGRGRGAAFTIRLPAKAEQPVAVERVTPAAAGAGRDHSGGRGQRRMRARACAWRWSFRATGRYRRPMGPPRWRCWSASARGWPCSTSGCPAWTVTSWLGACARRMGDAIVLVALTGYGGARDGAEAAQAGFDRHLIKPVDVDELVRVLAETRRARTAAASRP